MKQLHEKMYEELQNLLCELWSDANMALDDDWDRSNDGFQAQVENIEAFAAKYDITLTDTRE